MGFCVDILPVILELPDDWTVLDVAKSAQAQILESSEATSGVYRVLQDKRYRRLPATLTGFNYERQGSSSGAMFGAQASSLVMPHETMPWPTIVTIEEHLNGIELISEISESSDLAPLASQLPIRVVQVLSESSQPLAALRRS
jgi:hypothetical protein